MKSIGKFWLAIFVALLAGCETTPLIFKGPYFVRFSELELSRKESFSQPLEVIVHNAGPALNEDVLVTYKISGNAREGVDFVINGTPGQVTIPAGEYFGTIEIQLINNANNILRSQELVLTLEAVGAGLAVGQGESKIGKSFSLIIIDDCILGGNYVAEQGFANDDVTITSSDCETYLLSNWNIGVFNTSQEMDLVFIDNGDNTITIPEQEEDVLDPSQSTIMGSGVVDPVTREIILTITLVDFSNAQVILTLNPN